MFFYRWNQYVLSKFKSDSMTELAAHSCQIAGGMLGGFYGFRHAVDNNGGYFWKPSTMAVLGAGGGFVMGLHWRASVALIVGGDFVYTTLIMK